MVGAEFTNTDRRPRRVSHGRWRGSGRTSAGDCRGIRSRRRAAGRLPLASVQALPRSSSRAMGDAARDGAGAGSAGGGGRANGSSHTTSGWSWRCGRRRGWTGTS